MNELYDLYDYPSFERGKTKSKAKYRNDRSRFAVVDGIDQNGDFRCVHCQRTISTNPILSGVNNRNHCPYCLWSRHMDLHQAGDRLAACKGQMQPVGLTLKRTNKKYGKDSQGELMLIHRCVECGKLSANRIAADDINALVLETFERSLHLDPAIKARMAESGIQALDATDRPTVQARLMGWREYPWDA